MASGDVISVHGIDVNLNEVYGRMCEEARRTTDGRLVHDGGLKYLLGEMYGLPAHKGRVRKPLSDVRREVAAEFRRRGWVEVGKDRKSKNNGHYELRRPANAHGR